MTGKWPETFCSLPLLHVTFAFVFNGHELVLSVVNRELNLVQALSPASMFAGKNS